MRSQLLFFQADGPTTDPILGRAEKRPDFIPCNSPVSWHNNSCVKRTSAGSLWSLEPSGRIHPILARSIQPFLALRTFHLRSSASLKPKPVRHPLDRNAEDLSGNVSFAVDVPVSTVRAEHRSRRMARFRRGLARVSCWNPL